MNLFYINKNCITYKNNSNIKKAFLQGLNLFFRQLCSFVTLKHRDALKNYYVPLEHVDAVLPLLTFMVEPTMNLISGIYHEYEKTEHHISILQEHIIITRHAWQYYILIFIQSKTYESTRRHINPPLQWRNIRIPLKKKKKKA